MPLETLTYWHWWILGVALIVLEMFAPGTFFLWMGIASGLVGFILLLAPELGWQYQLPGGCICASIPPGLTAPP